MDNFEDKIVMVFDHLLEYNTLPPKETIKDIIQEIYNKGFEAGIIHNRDNPPTFPDANKNL